ncbi:MAG: hypothetical protein ACREP3_04310 [Candidatus Binatia bacterium]
MVRENDNDETGGGDPVAGACRPPLSMLEELIETAAHCIDKIT